jgi:hypothetical protein
MQNNMITRVYNNKFYNVRAPFALDRHNGSNESYVDDDNVYLGNQVFWSYSELNTIEQQMKAIYDAFDALS